MQDVHDKLFFEIVPLLVELEERKLINGFHFIIHENIDLRLSCEDWSGRKGDKIVDVLRKVDLPYSFDRWSGLDPDLYGGEPGVASCYNNLESNSRLIIGLLRADYEEDKNPVKAQREVFRRKRQSFITSQWPHYLRSQYGIDNELEAMVDFVNFWSWTKSLFKASKKRAVVCVIHSLLWGLFGIYRR